MAEHRVVAPKGAIRDRFVPAQTFEAEVNGRRSVYLQGQSYVVRNDAIETAVAKWRKQGKVV